MCRQSWFIMADGRMRCRTQDDRTIETEGLPEADGIYIVKALDMLTAPGKDFLITTFE